MEALIRAYERFVRLPWSDAASSGQRIWFAIHEPRDERRIRTRLDAFAAATLKAGHGWKTCDLTDEFARWMAASEYRESYFETPEDIEMALEDFVESVAENVRAVLGSSGAGEVVALCGVGSLFGLARVSRLLEMVSDGVEGRLLVFFPGEHGGGNYRLLDARDGWNYLAIPITAEEREQA